MRVKATKKMMMELNKKAVGNYCIDFFELLKEPYDIYNRIVFDPFEHEEDYNTETGLFNVIKVIYKPDMFSLPRYITTEDLRHEYHKGDTLDRFITRVINAYEI